LGYKKNVTLMTKDTGILFLMAIVAILLALLWLLIRYVLSKILKQYSLSKVRTIATLTVAILFVGCVFYFLYWLQNYGC
jgi:hypothetical protein